jgi:thiol-disulfide isomerase/thioredoxin
MRQRRTLAGGDGERPARGAIVPCRRDAMLISPTPTRPCSFFVLAFASVVLAQEPAPVRPAPAAPVVPAAPIAPRQPAAPQAPKPPAVDPRALIGKPPPPLTVAKWVKGEPLTELAKGKVWVVDFWATWCGPCKGAIPHLTKLARGHAGKVEVVGIAISERQQDASDLAYIDVVQQFVDKQGERMAYRVAVDTPDKKMHATWFKPTGTGGIPTAYIVDQQGLVAWTGIGDPATLARIVEAVLAGTFDSNQEAALQAKLEAAAKQRAAENAAKARAGDQAIDAKVPGYRAAMENGDTAAALAALDAAFLADPKLEASGPYQWKLMLLMQRSRPAEVNGYVRELMQRHRDNDDVIGFASACIVATGEDPPRFDVPLALETAERTAKAAQPDSRWQQFARWRLGWALWHAGDKVRAIAQMEQALAAVRRLKEKFDFDDLDLQCEDALRVFRR